METIKDKIMNTKILAAIGIVCMILGTLFAYFTILGISVSLLRYWEGYVIILAAIANLLIIFKAYVERFLPKIFRGKIGQFLTSMQNPKASLIPTGIVAILVIYMHFAIKSSYIHYGFGFFLELIGIIALAAYPFLYKGETTTSGMDNETK